ncbi:hypothetical protein AB0873_17785 [Micromonospora sp. NPDC047707]|uniref:hypothetical protein n=1 Tax=Micromonospora sp. NPDC047707 TaxID=3154498 RepID=UPI00345622B8
MRIRPRLSALVALVLVAGAVLVPAAPAAADLDGCYDSTTPRFQDPAPWSAPGNVHTGWSTPAGVVRGDAFRITATGTVRIDFWGTTKNVAGELPLPPDNGDWPAPDAPRYALIARVTDGEMLVLKNGRSYGQSRWFPVGADSGCLLFLGNSIDRRPHLVFTVNDPNLGDNGGGASVRVRQWF